MINSKMCYARVEALRQLALIEPLAGSVGDSRVDALAETINGLQSVRSQNSPLSPIVAHCRFQR